MAVKIRKLIASDYEQVKSLIVEVQELHVQLRPDIYKMDDPIFPDQYFAQLVSAGMGYVAVTENEKSELSLIVGVLLLTPREVSDPVHIKKAILLIDTLVVKKEYRGQGIGHMLLNQAKIVKQDNHYDSLELQVNAKNRKAYDLYRSYGFSDKSINMELTPE